MKPEKLSELLQNIDEGLIARAGKRRKKSRAAIIRIVAVCACLALVMTVTFKLAFTKPEVFDKGTGTDNVTTDGTEIEMPDTDMPEGDIGSPSDGATRPDNNRADASDDGDDAFYEDEDENGKQNSTPQSKPTADDAVTDNAGSSAGTSVHPVTKAADPYPYFTKNIKFTCGGYVIEQLYLPEFTSGKYRYSITDTESGKSLSKLTISDSVDFEGLPVIPYAAKTVLTPVTEETVSRIEDRAYWYDVFRGKKSGTSTQYVSVYPDTRGGGGELTRTSHTPVTLTKALHGGVSDGESILLVENAAVVEYEGEKHLFCAPGYLPIKPDTEYIFIVKKIPSDTISNVYRPAEADKICIFEITDEVKNAGSADELKGLSDAEKEIYQRYYYDTL